jgi:dTDP-glucose 4,6-dehydratase/UDP-glucose 4-epimerase
MKKYLVTGGTGFVGSALVKRLVGEGHFVRILDNNSRGVVSRLGKTARDVEFVEADIRDFDSVCEAGKGIDVLVHLAFINGTEFFYKKPDLVLDVGVRGMLSVIDACRKNEVGELALASSSEVYQIPPVIPTDETVPLYIPDPFNPRYSYAGGKIISELMAINYGRRVFERVIIFRPHNVYGPDMGWEHVLPQFVLRALENIEKTPSGPVPFPIQGDGSQTRAFCHIDDFIDGLFCLFEMAAHLNIYNIGNPEEITIRDVAKKVVASFGREARIIPGTKPEGGTPRRCPDISKVRALGYQPQITFDEGLPPVVRWYAENRDKRPS